MPRLLTLLDELRRLQTVETRHLHVEENHGERLPEELQERLFARARLDQPHFEGLQGPFQREEVLGPVVDEQHARNQRIGRLWHRHLTCRST